MLNFPYYFQIHDISKASKGVIMEERVKRPLKNRQKKSMRLKDR